MIKQLLVYFTMLLLCACSDSNVDLVKYIKDIKARPSKHIEPIPQFKPLTIFAFPGHDKRRNPFVLFEEKQENNKFAPDSNRPKELLEGFPLDSLKFVGTLKAGNQQLALIKSSDNKVMAVHIGNYLGQNFGRIVSIKNDEITLEETINKIGTWQKVLTTLHIDKGAVDK
jgi:type IV pilus assembly protein PilP